LEGGLCTYKSAGLIEIGTLVLQDAMLRVIFVVRTGPLTLNIFNGILFSHQPPEISIEDGMQFPLLNGVTRKRVYASQA
jgi:hypothetical protein